MKKNFAYDSDICGLGGDYGKLKNCADITFEAQCFAEQKYVRGAMTRSLLYSQVRAIPL